MSILSDFEDRLGRGIEGIFAGTFRSHVQPVEIAKALAREMDDGRAIGVGRVYAPTRFSVTLSVADQENLGGFAEVLSGELATYLVSHAREKSYHLVGKPKVVFGTSDSLKVGRFHVDSELPAREAGKTMPPAPDPHGMATVTVGDTNHDVTLAGSRIVIGRLAECDICVSDVNASRQHAAFVWSEQGWQVEDLGSTNGTKVNGSKMERRLLTDGDVITVGATRLVFHEHGS